jgi:hypothetical protein
VCFSETPGCWLPNRRNRNGGRGRILYSGWTAFPNRTFPLSVDMGLRESFRTLFLMRVAVAIGAMTLGASAAALWRLF